MQKSRQKSPSGAGTIAQLCRSVSSQLRHVSTIGKKTGETAISPVHGPTIWRSSAYQLLRSSCWRVWGTPANFNGFRVLATLLHGSLVVGISQICDVEQRAPPIFGRAAGCHHVGHWPTFLVFSGIGCAFVVWGGEGKL